MSTIVTASIIVTSGIIANAETISESITEVNEANSETNYEKTDVDISLENDGYNLVSEEGYIDDETGLFFVDKTYVKDNNPSDVMPLSVTPFNKVVSKTRTIYGTPTATSGTRLFTMYVSGDFICYYEEDIVVKDVEAYTKSDNVSGSWYLDKKLTWENNCGSNIIGHMYAYIEYIITVKFPSGEKADLKLWLDVNVLGEETVKN